MSRIAILGAGSWGTALALVLERRGGHSVVLWSHTERVVKAIQQTGSNAIYLPGLGVPPTIQLTTELVTAVQNTDILVLAVPSAHVRTLVGNLAAWLTPQQLLVNAAKGIEDGSGLRMSEVIAESLTTQRMQNAYGVLSGPSFAEEVGRGRPTAITIASNNAALATRVQEDFSSLTLRLYTNEDVVGVELGGALKNVIAIAAGAAHGLELGHNSIAALITRGIAEMTRLALACGGKRETLAGLAGLGDLVLTCTGSLSRNRHVGVELGRGHSLSEILQNMHGHVAEGVRTTHAALELARTHGVEMPITEQVGAVLKEHISARDAMRELMARPGRDE